MNFDVNYLAALARSLAALALSCSPRSQSQGGAGEKYELVLGIPVRTPAERRGEENRRLAAVVQICSPQNLYFCINKPPSLPPSLSLSHCPSNQAPVLISNLVTRRQPFLPIRSNLKPPSRRLIKCQIFC